MVKDYFHSERQFPTNVSGGVLRLDRKYVARIERKRNPGSRRGESCPAFR